MEIFGWGKKNTADVNSAGQLKTSSSIFAEDHDASIHGDAYTMDIDGITSAVDEHWLAVIKNGHSTLNLVVTCVHIMPNQAKDDQQIRIYVGGTFSYLAEGTLVVPVNILASKSGGAQGDFYVSDGSADIMTTITAGSVANRFPVPARQPYDCCNNGNWVIPPDQCFMVRPTKDSKFYGFISFYYHESH